ncbi:MAG TPA: hypothetical protein DCW53_01550 [Rikenellaceae bacterium]|nr:hypothetical protein [Rikenellaceae bacterium]
MGALGESIPKYLLNKHQLTWTVTFSALFAIVSILLFFPFDNYMWFGLSNRSVFVSTIIFIASSLLIIILSRTLMYQVGKSHSLSLFWYIFWNLSELLVLAIYYWLFTDLSVKFGVIDRVDLSDLAILLRSFVFLLIALGIPYIIASLYLALVDKNNTIRLMNYSNVVSDAPVKPYEEKRITLFDSNGVLKFSVDADNLYYIESDDNYIKVWYTDSDGTVKQYMLRCSLKTVEDSFAGSTLVRCHRKFIVNIGKVHILRAGKDGYKINIGLDNVDLIPISKTYEQNVLARFNSR